MVIRELKNGCCFVSTQEDHAELSAQLAAHWGNEKFSRLRPYDTMVFATTYHDSGAVRSKKPVSIISPSRITRTAPKRLV